MTYRNTARSSLLDLHRSIHTSSSGILPISVLGCTGSVGRSTIDLVLANPDRFSIVGLAAHSNWELTLQQAKVCRPLAIAFACETAAFEASKAFPNAPFEILAGSEGIKSVATMNETHAVVAAIVGFAGLESTLSALDAGRPVALANKEAIVCGASLVRKSLMSSESACLFPVDSEHSALFQSLLGNHIEDVERLWLTASGGPFRLYNEGQLNKVTPQQALKHPTWNMGAKITIDSATLMNKALELIEACELFGLEEGQIEVVVHPESIVHSLVEYCDGSQIAQLSVPDMKGAIGHALACCDTVRGQLLELSKEGTSSLVARRLSNCMDRLKLTDFQALNFHQLDESLFSAIKLARSALNQGGSLPVVFNAANEIAVTAFLANQIGFQAITHLVEGCLDLASVNGFEVEAKSFSELKSYDFEARRIARSLLQEFAVQ